MPSPYSISPRELSLSCPSLQIPLALRTFLDIRAPESFQDSFWSRMEHKAKMSMISVLKSYEWTAHSLSGQVKPLQLKLSARPELSRWKMQGNNHLFLSFFITSRRQLTTNTSYSSHSFTLHDFFTEYSLSQTIIMATKGAYAPVPAAQAGTLSSDSMGEKSPARAYYMSPRPGLYCKWYLASEVREQ